jgi:hypothetical protein
MALMSDPDPQTAAVEPDLGFEEVMLTARGIATAVAPDDGLTAVQAQLLGAIASSMTGFDVDYHSLEPLGPDELAGALAHRDQDHRQRIVHHMVLAELILKPIPVEVAARVAKYAQALGIKDDFVRVARRYAQGAYGLAWMDLQRSGFEEHVRDTGDAGVATRQTPAKPLDPAKIDPELEARWTAFRELPSDSLGRCVVEMYDGRGFILPGAPGGAPEYLAQHDFVHVLADYGTNLRGEIEVFACIGRADPDPKGFAWLATLIGLFETGYIEGTGFFDRDVRERHAQGAGMHVRIADAIRRGKLISTACRTDLFLVDYYALAERPVPEVRAILNVPEKSQSVLELGSPGAFDLEGMSEMQRRFAKQREGTKT